MGRRHCSVILILLAVLTPSASAGNVAAPGQAAPVALTPPTVSGNSTPGQTLSTTTGSWSGPTATFAYQWSRCDSGGAACAAMTGETSATHAVTATDVGSTVRATVMATNKNGSAVTTSAATAVVITTPAPTPTSTATPTTTTTTATTTTATTTTTLTTTTTTTPTTTTTVSPNRQVYCFGDPLFGLNGFDSTAAESASSNGWVRQGYTGTIGQRLVYDDSVNVMQSLGCHTVRAEIQPNDLARDGSIGTSQKANIAKGPGWPALGMQEGLTRWYGFAFSTNPGYVPHSSDPALGDYSGNFNLVYSFHNYILNGVWGPQANIQLQIATISPSDNRACWTYAPGVMHKIAPVWDVKISGGDQNDALWYTKDADPSSDSTNRECAFYSSPFVAGHRYKVQFRVTWSSKRQGAVQLWLDGVQVMNVTGVSNMYYSGTSVDNGIYPVFENYRKYDTSLPTNDVYYGGLIAGSTQADVAVP